MQHGNFFSSGGPPQHLQIGLGTDEQFAAAWNFALAMLEESKYPRFTRKCRRILILPLRRPKAQPWRIGGRVLCEPTGNCTPADPRVYKVSKRFQVAFMAVAILLDFWTDCSLPMRHVAGFSKFGLLGRT